MAAPTIFIAGGAGFIGSHIAKMAHRAGYNTLVYDNLSRGNRQNVCYGDFEEGDLADIDHLDVLFRRRHFDAVMHFAALIDVGESCIAPEKYYRNNVSYTLNLLDVVVRHRVNVFIFSSSAAIFGLPQTAKIAEDHPKEPISPYGCSKLMVEQIVADVAQAHGLRYSFLRYFNAAGGDPEGEIPYRQRAETNLIPYALRCLQQRDSLTIFGTDYPTPDGSCIRDYVHIEDLGTAHLLALEQLLQGGPSTAYNLGSERGFSVREVIDSIARITGQQLSFLEGKRRPGDPAILIADATKACQELRWRPCYSDLDIIIAHAYAARTKI